MRGAIGHHSTRAPIGDRSGSTDAFAHSGSQSRFAESKPRRSRHRRELARPTLTRAVQTPVEPRTSGVAFKSSESEASRTELPVKESPTEPAQEQYQWQNAWYPLAIAADLPTDRPTAVRLLGEAIVLWHDSTQWRAFTDLCPHRLAKLSEGRIEGGELMCSYHGWQFGGDGRCTRIPQADDERSHQTATASRRSCSTVHPCEVHEGLVWVFAGTGAQAEAESRRTPKASLPKLADPAYTMFTPWFQRDLPYGADVLCENVIDPSHVPFSHHGIQGNRFKVAKMLMRPPESSSAADGFKVHSYTPESVTDGERRTAYDISFRPPSLIRYHYSTGSELVTHAIPTDPGCSRIFFTLLVPKSRLKGLLGFVLKLKTSKWLLWSDHITRNSVLDGDSVFLALQDEELQRRGTDLARNYYMPASLDHGVRSLRDWLARLAAPLPWAAGALPRPVPGSRSRRAMLDRYGQHTQHCPSCLAAHKTFSITQWVSAFVTTVAAAYAAFVLGNGSPVRKLVAPMLLAAAAAAGGFLSRRFKNKLEFEDYIHSEH